MANFIKMGKFHQINEFSSQCRNSIILISWHQNDEASSQRWIFITTINFDYSCKFTHLSILVLIEAELGLAQPQLVLLILHFFKRCSNLFSLSATTHVVEVLLFQHGLVDSIEIMRGSGFYRYLNMNSFQVLEREKI